MEKRPSVPNLALQASAFYRYKLANDKEHSAFAASCDAEDLKQQLIDCVELFPNGKECFNAWSTAGSGLPLPLAWNNDGVTYDVRRKTIPTTSASGHPSQPCKY
jgi:hypothetical protein